MPQPSTFIECVNLAIAQKKISVTELKNILNCSADSLYRRLRGQTDFMLDQAITIANHLHISLDQIYNLPIQSVPFNIQDLTTPTHTDKIKVVEQYINTLHHDLSTVDKNGVVALYYAAKDIPIFCFFSSPELISFKLYFWHHVLFAEGNTKMPYKPNWLPQATINKALEIYQIYNRIHSIEIWNFETINSTLHQISYCKNSGLINTKEAKSIIKSLENFITNLESDCETGKKSNKGNLKIYFNEILLLDDSVIFDMGETKVFYLPYQTLNFLSTYNTNFVNTAISWMERQQTKSTLISQAGEKDRYRLFSHYYQTIKKCSKEIE